MRRSTMMALALIALLVGLSACAKYPVVVNASTPPPTASTQTPAR
jgi:hypothetical protein